MLVHLVDLFTPQFKGIEGNANIKNAPLIINDNNLLDSQASGWLTNYQYCLPEYKRVDVFEHVDLPQ